MSKGIHIRQNATNIDNLTFKLSETKLQKTIKDFLSQYKSAAKKKFENQPFT